MGPNDRDDEVRSIRWTVAAIEENLRGKIQSDSKLPSEFDIQHLNNRLSEYLQRIETKLWDAERQRRETFWVLCFIALCMSVLVFK